MNQSHNKKPHFLFQIEPQTEALDEELLVEHLNLE